MKTDEQIVEGNRLIAEFDNKYTTDSNDWVKSNKRLVHEYEYHSSWDWLRNPIMKAHDECKLYSEGLKFFEGLTIFSTIQQVWQAVIEFIKWVNNQNK